MAHGGARHRRRASGRPAADHGRADRAQLRVGSGARRRARGRRRGAHRREPRRHRQSRGPRALHPGDAAHWLGDAAFGHRAQLGGSPAGAKPHRLPLHHSAVVHARRQRRRRGLQPRRVRGDLPARVGSLPHQRTAHRRIAARLEGVRDGGGARQARQLHHRLFHRERRPDGHPHRRLHHRGAGANLDRQGVSTAARRLHRRAARNRRGNRRRQRAVRHRPGERAHGGDRDESARVAFLGAGLEGHGLPNRQSGHQARGGLHAGRAGQRHHRRHAGLLRARQSTMW